MCVCVCLFLCIERRHLRHVWRLLLCFWTIYFDNENLSECTRRLFSYFSHFASLPHPGNGANELRRNCKEVTCVFTAVCDDVFVFFHLLCSKIKPQQLTPPHVHENKYRFIFIYVVPTSLHTKRNICMPTIHACVKRTSCLCLNKQK